MTKSTIQLLVGGVLIAGVAGFFVYDRQSRLPGQSCGSDSSCKAVPGYAPPKCEQLQDHKSCVVPCKVLEPEDRLRGTLGKYECPSGTSCRKMSYSRMGSGDWYCVAESSPR